MKPVIEQCSVCKHDFVVAQRRATGPVCLTCKMKEDAVEKAKSGPTSSK